MLCGAAHLILIIAYSFPGIIVKRSILIYSIALMFVAGGFTVASTHNHFQDLCDTKNLQTICHYLKNPVVTKSNLIIVALSTPSLLPIIYGINFFTATALYPIDAPVLKKQRLVALSSFPHRAPPGR